MKRSSQLNSNAVLHELMTQIAKVVEIIGGSDKGWTEAAQAALDEAKKTIRGITGLEVNDIMPGLILALAGSPVQSWSKVSLQSGTLLTSRTVIPLFF